MGVYMSIRCSFAPTARIMRCLFPGLAFLLLLVSPVVSALHDTDLITGQAAWPWQKIEHIRDRSPGFVQEPFHPKNRHSNRTIQKAFGTEEPHSSSLLLHYAEGWDRPGRTPVLLVHGAGDNASRGFAHPFDFDIPDNGIIDKPGLMQYLVSRGFAVFALTFSHPHGDNFLQAQQLSNAIKRIRQVTGAASVDVVCHSKGSLPVRIYASDLSSQYSDYHWITPYQGDIRKVLFIAAPLKGVDTAFRYYLYNYMVMLQDDAAPLAPSVMTWFGMPVSTKEHNRMFPGQFQMLYNWVEEGIGFNSYSSTADANYTRNILYHGGISTLASSSGINKAIRDAGSVIARLNRKGVHPDIECHVLAGNRQEVEINGITVLYGELAASSDGVVFLQSATYTDGLAAAGAKIGSVKVMYATHAGITFIPEALQHIAEVLAR